MIKEETNKIQNKIGAGILSAISNVKKDRDTYYESNEAPELSNISNIISHYGNKNGTVSGLAAIVPGPLGMLTVVPDIITVTRNQINMIYDIAKAHKKEESITKELIIGILLSSMGSSAISLLAIHGGKVMSKRAGASLIQKLINILGGKILQKTISTTASRYIPIAGAAAMAGWSKYATSSIGNKAVEIFSKEIIQEEEIIEDIEIKSIKSLSYDKILIFINLLKADGIKHCLEIEHVKSLINDSGLDKSDKSKLFESLLSNDIHDIDYNSLITKKEDSFSIVIDLISLAKVDGEFHIAEQMYIKQIATKLGISDIELKVII